jgi:tetratricopeptide (TPR) repeat protein
MGKILPVAAALLALGSAPLEAAQERLEPEPRPQVEPSHLLDYAEAKELLARQKWAEAAIILRTVLRKKPDYTPAAMDLARSLAYSGRREEALGILSQAASRERGAQQAQLVRRAEVLSRLFLTNDTFQIFQDGLNHVVARKYGAARERFNRALAQEPDNVEALIRVAQCLVMEGDNDSAVERLRLARRLNPYEPEIRLWLGRAMHQRGELAEAIVELREAYDRLEKSELAPVWLADALVSLGRRSAATQILEEDIKAQPFHLESILALARLRTGAAARGPQPLWQARKELQLALSRLDKYAPEGSPGFETELGMDLRRNVAEVRSDAQRLLDVIEGRIEEVSAED